MQGSIRDYPFALFRLIIGYRFCGSHLNDL